MNAFIKPIFTGLLFMASHSAFAAQKMAFEAVNMGNGSAQCKFSFFDNGTFEARWRLMEVSEPKDMDIIKSKGKFVKEGANIKLQVANKKELDILKELFADSEKLSVEEKARKVKLPADFSGVLCLGVTMSVK